MCILGELLPFFFQKMQLNFSYFQKSKKESQKMAKSAPGRFEESPDNIHKKHDEPPVSDWLGRAVTTAPPTLA